MNTTMTYSESAHGVMINYQRAEKEVFNHGHIPGSHEFTEFIQWWEEMNTNGEVDAGLLLEWLGY